MVKGRISVFCRDDLRRPHPTPALFPKGGEGAGALCVFVSRGRALSPLKGERAGVRGETAPEPCPAIM